MGIPHEIALLYSIEDEITREKQNKKPVLEPWGKTLLWGKGEPLKHNFWRKMSSFDGLRNTTIFVDNFPSVSEISSTLTRRSWRRFGRTLGYGPTGGRRPAGSIPGQPVTKSRSTADLRVGAVGKLFTLIALAG